MAASKTLTAASTAAVKAPSAVMTVGMTSGSMSKPRYTGHQARV